jgi:hypothetical protein
MDPKITTVAFEEDGQWVVQGLERDICAQGETEQDAMDRFLLAVRLEKQEPGGIERIPPAPEGFWLLHNFNSASTPPLTPLHEE